MQPQRTLERETDLEIFRAPEGYVLPTDGLSATTVEVTSIVRVASHHFEFRENAHTPGRLLEQAVAVDVPQGAGLFCSVPYFTAAYTTPDFVGLSERPLGELLVSVGMRGNNLVCQVMLSDRNGDDPILIRVAGVVVFFR
jgi:hypothetical protein